MRKKTLVMIVMVIVVTAGLVGCEDDSSTTTDTEPVATLTQDYGVLAEGQLVPEQHIELSFGIAGRVTELLVQEGDTVKAGQQIAILDNLPQLQASYAQATANVERSAISLQQAELGLEQANATIQQTEYSLAQAEAETLRSEHTLSQAQLEDSRLTLERAQATLGNISAQQHLDTLRDSAKLVPAQIESEIQEALTLLQTVEDALPVVDKPDIQYYEQQVLQSENILHQIQYGTAIVDIGALTDTVDSTEDIMEDEKEFLEKVEASVGSCQVDVETGSLSFTKLEFSEKLTYRGETYDAGRVYDVENWIADELLDEYDTIVSKATIKCDSERKVTIDGRTTTLVDAQDTYNDIVSNYDEAVLELKKARLQNEESVRAAQMDLARVQRNLEWALSEEYSREGIILAAAQSADDPAVPQSISLATQQLQAKMVLAQAQLDDARQRLSELQDGIDPDEKELAEAQLAQAAAHAEYADTQIEQNELLLKQAELNLQVAHLQHKSAAVSVNLATMQQENAATSVESARAQERSDQAMLESAKADLARNELRAPWSGSIADLPLQLGAYVQPGQHVATLADLSTWEVETDNLTEIEVPEVFLGQKVSITPDALPELDLPGVVAAISPLHTEKRGDVTYTVTVDLQQSDPRLRWGMTMVVTFPTSE